MDIEIIFEKLFHLTKTHSRTTRLREKILKKLNYKIQSIFKENRCLSEFCFNMFFNFVTVQG